jgi:hypothetical protein
VLHKPLRDEPRHHLAGVVLPLAAVEAQRESEGVSEVFGGGGRKAIGRVGHAATVARRQEQDKNGRNIRRSPALSGRAFKLRG